LSTLFLKKFYFNKVKLTLPLSLFISST